MGNGGPDREDRSKSNAGAGDGGKGSSGLLYPGDSSFATTLLAGVKGGKGESWARCVCNDYTQVGASLPPPLPFMEPLGTCFFFPPAAWVFVCLSAWRDTYVCTFMYTYTHGKDTFSQRLSWGVSIAAQPGA